MLTSKVGKIGKVVICGMKGVGKTAILEQLIYGSINPDSVSIFVYLFRSIALLTISSVSGIVFND